MKPSSAWWMALAGIALLAAPVRAQQAYTITGTVSAGGQGLADVTMVLGGAASDTTTTNDNGEFTFAALPAGTYTVTPQRDGYTFAPESLTMTFPATGTTTPVFEASMVATGTERDHDVPAALGLAQNYPNPFNAATTIRYRVAEAGPVRLDVVDLLGRTVAVLVDDVRGAGLHTATFDARPLPGGFYLCRLQAGAVVLTRAMVRAK